MNQGQFKAQVNTAWRILRRLHLDKERIWLPNYPANPAAEFRSRSYLDVWKICFSNQYYDFLLADGSLFQFRAYSHRPLRVSYAFLECPFEGTQYSGLAMAQLQALLPAPYDLSPESIPEPGAQPIVHRTKDTVTPIRYDYDPERYNEGYHPASHMHFGHDSMIRVATVCVLRPMSFLLFVIRQRFVEQWRELLTMQHAQHWCRQVREALDEVPSEFITQVDKQQMMLW